MFRKKLKSLTLIPTELIILLKVLTRSMRKIQTFPQQVHFKPVIDHSHIYTKWESKLCRGSFPLRWVHPAGGRILIRVSGDSLL